MHLLSGIALALSLAHAAIIESRSTHPVWKRSPLTAKDSRILLHIAVRQDDASAAADTLLELATPNHPRFRKHLSAREAGALSEPSRDSVSAVEQWLAEHKLNEHSVLSSGIFIVDTTIQGAEDLLNATYHLFTDNGDASNSHFRTESFHIPDHVMEHIDFVTPTTQLPRIKAIKSPMISDGQQVLAPSVKRDSCSANDNTTPTCVRQVYGIDYNAQPNRTTYAVYGTEAASFNPADLQTYLSKYNPVAAAAHATYQVIGNGDPNATTSSGIESQFETALDTQTLLGLAWPASGILYNNGGVFGPHPGQTYDRFVSFLLELITNDTVPSVVSFSESMPEDMVDPAYARRLCSMMAQVGARGVSLLFSTGDNGPNGDQPSGTHANIFEPEFPASCPFVTAVGGTTNLANETAATKSTISAVGQVSYTASGGGFSNLFPIPSYQQEVVPAYIQQHVPASYYNISGFNASGRGIPDLSAFSTNFPTVVSLFLGIPLTIPIGGTSASTPLWAAVITLLNDYEASQGRPALGFLNPWLYSLRQGLKDITTGGNSAGSCNYLAGCRLSQTLGYDVATGWDPVTGLGSPIWKELVESLDSTAGAA